MVKVGDEFGSKECVGTLEDCEEVWPIRAAEIFWIHMNQVPLSRTKKRVCHNKYLILDATIRFCNEQKLKQTMIIWPTRIASRVTKPTDRRSNYVIFIAILTQQWIQDCATMIYFVILPLLFCLGLNILRMPVTFYLIL